MRLSNLAVGIFVVLMGLTSVPAYAAGGNPGSIISSDSFETGDMRVWSGVHNPIPTKIEFTECDRHTVTLYSSFATPTIMVGNGCHYTITLPATSWLRHSFQYRDQAGNWFVNPETTKVNGQVVRRVRENPLRHEFTQFESGIIMDGWCRSNTECTEIFWPATLHDPIWPTYTVVFGMTGVPGQNEMETFWYPNPGSPEEGYYKTLLAGPRPMGSYQWGAYQGDPHTGWKIWPGYLMMHQVPIIDGTKAWCDATGDNGRAFIEGTLTPEAWINPPKSACEDIHWLP